MFEIIILGLCSTIFIEAAGELVQATRLLHVGALT